MPTWLIVLLCTLGAGMIVLPALAAVSVFGVRRYIANAKTAEARNSVATIARDAATTQAASHALCASASQPVPANMLMLKGSKYQSAPSDWTIDEASNAGFACLGYRMDTPQYYQYSYKATGAPERRAFDAVAHGDLDGDGAVSTFKLHGEVGGDGAVAIAPTIVELSPEE